MLKSIKIILLILLSFLPQLVQAQLSASQDWMPLALGNKWLYIVTTVVNPPYGDPICDIRIDSVKEKIVINGLDYFKLNTGTFDYTYRYDKDLQILYERLSDDSDYVVIDFTKDPGYQYFYSLGIATIIEGNDNLFDSLYFYKGFSYMWIYGHSEHRFAKNIGQFYSYDWADISGQPPQEYTLELVETILFDSISLNHYTYNIYPQITITPITKISSSNFELDFSVDHFYTKNNLNFVDSVIMYSHYLKGDSIVNAMPVLAINQPLNTESYFISTTIDTGLLISGFTYNYRFTAKDKHLVPKYDFAPDTGYYIAVWDSATFIEDEIKKDYAENFYLAQNYPNPFNPSTKINYSIPKSGDVSLKVYDILGINVASLVNEFKEAGINSVEFNASSLPSGTYFYQLKAGDFVETKKMILLK